MWKCASNCFLATLNKSLFKSGNAMLSTKVIDPRQCNSLLKLSPALLERFTRYYGFYKDGCGKFSEGKKRRKNPNEKKNSFLGGFDNNVFDALTWSGVFVLGYYFLQPFRQKKWKHCYENGNYSISSGYQYTVNCLLDAFRIRPINYVLPEVKAAKTKTVAVEIPSSEQTKPVPETNIFEKAHQKVSGVLSNWMGIQHMQCGNHEEALEFFIKSAEEENAAGIFNLGICHEKGLGTNQDLHRAAELYQKATDLGHAKAMYNLGVFYARGLGVDEVDVDRARQLFTAAAQLGQKDAENALNAESSMGMDSISHEKGSIMERTGEEGEDQVEDFIYRFLFTDSIRQTSASLAENLKLLSEDELGYGEGLCDNDSGVLDLSPRLEPDDLHL